MYFIDKFIFSDLCRKIENAIFAFLLFFGLPFVAFGLVYCLITVVSECLK